MHCTFADLGSNKVSSSSSVFIGLSPVDRSYKSCLLTHHSSNLLMRGKLSGKLSAKHYVRPAHVKAGFK